MLKISNLTKRFGRHLVLDNIALEVEDSEFVALLGPSGSGKTTLLRIIAGFEDADAGEVRIANRIVVHDTLSVAPERRRIGMVFQDYALFPHLSVRENVAFGLTRKDDKEALVREALRAVDMEHWIDTMPHVLSGGQQQRIALARALAPNPGIVLLDEPFSNLDHALRASVRADVRAILRDAGVTAVLVTHDQEEALSVADRVAVLFDGSMQHVGTPQEVYHQPATRAVARFVGDAQFLDGEVQGDRIETELGSAPILNDVSSGPATAMLRPELVSVVPEGASGVAATVVNTQFFGRDQRLELTLDSGTRIIARVPTDRVFEVGEVVAIGANRPLFVIPPEQEA